MSTFPDTPLLGAVEAGGTKFNCGVLRGSNWLLEKRIPTTSPEDTLPAVLDFFTMAERAFGRVDAFGVASFGPLDLTHGSPMWGRITTTPKPGWSGTDIAGAFRRTFDRPVAFDTDVNGAALGEFISGSAKGCASAVYITVGTGVGAGAVIEGEPLHGLIHPEMGHIRPRRHELDRSFPGICPFHGDCMEGLISGPAIIARCGRAFTDLDHNHPLRDIVADYLGQMCAQIVFTLSPDRIVIGGGVMATSNLHPQVASRMRHWIGGLLHHSALDGDQYVHPPAQGGRSGLIGAAILASRLARARTRSRMQTPQRQ